LILHQFNLYSRATKLIDTLVENQIPIGIVTAGQKTRILKTVPGTVLGKFNTLVTGDMTKQGKPFPDHYLMGSASLGIAPEQSIVVENAPLGIQAAKAYCIAICSTLESLYLQEADLSLILLKNYPHLT
jgi:beta-phosphoglucomutase-like phosphatase (HAD superfamily)